MKKTENVETGTIGLVQQQEDGRILQIGLSVEQNRLLQIFLAQISKDSPFILMGDDWEFVLKKNLCKM